MHNEQFHYLIIIEGFKKNLKTQYEIKCWLNAMDIQFYELVPNEKYGYVVDVKSNVDLIGRFHQEKLALSHIIELPEMSKTTYKI